MRLSWRTLVYLTTVLPAFVLLIPIAVGQTQKFESKDRDRAQTMLSLIKVELKKNYYDPNFRSMDLDTRFSTASEKIKQASSVGQAFGIIAQLLTELNDSHTYFIPPARSYDTDYGWTMMAVGDRCYVSSVDKGSDAEAKGLKPGDEIVQAGGYDLHRSNLSKFQYLYNALRPQPGIRVLVRSPNSEPRQLDLAAQQKQKPRITNLEGYNVYMDRLRKAQREAEFGRDRFKSFGNELLVWKMNEFDLTDFQVDDVMSKVKKHKALILDLRGNRGGWVSTITRLTSNLFDRDITIGENKYRKEVKPLFAKTRGDKAFTGKLIVLVDSRSASASEVLARTVQLQKRGIVIGDQTAGAVMASIKYWHQVGLDVVIFFGVSVTVSDLVMSDGKSLEHHGVTPDELKLPTAEDIASARDVVLSYAASLVGVALDPFEAGKIIPLEPVVRNN